MPIRVTARGLKKNFFFKDKWKNSLGALSELHIFVQRVCGESTKDKRLRRHAFHWRMSALRQTERLHHVKAWTDTQTSTFPLSLSFFWRTLNLALLCVRRMDLTFNYAVSDGHFRTNCNTRGRCWDKAKRVRIKNERAVKKISGVVKMYLY